MNSLQPPSCLLYNLPVSINSQESTSRLCLEGAEDNLWVSVLPLSYVHPRDGTLSSDGQQEPLLTELSHAQRKVLKHVYMCVGCVNAGTRMPQHT